MTTVSNAFSDLVQKIQSFETLLSASTSAQSAEFTSFESALSAAIAAGQNLVSVNLADNPNTSDINALTSSAAASSENIPALEVTGALSHSAAETNSATTPAIEAASSSATAQQPLGTAYLLTAGVSANKPSIAQFMSVTGVDFDTAAELLYGVIGSNTDRRDWAAIMAGGNPLADARASTGALYNGGKVKSDSRYVLLSDGQGNLLRATRNPEQASNWAVNFGFESYA